LYLIPIEESIVIPPPVIFGDVIVIDAVIVPAVILPASRFLITAPSIYVTPPSTMNGALLLPPELFTIWNLSACIVKSETVGLDKILKPVTLPAVTLTPYSPEILATLPETVASVVAVVVMLAARDELAEPTEEESVDTLVAREDDAFVAVLLTSVILEANDELLFVIELRRLSIIVAADELFVTIVPLTEIILAANDEEAL